MDLLRAFKEYLLTQPYPTSQLTVKNYLADIKRFISWYEETHKQTFVPEDITLEILTEYKQYIKRQDLSNPSVNRYLSSLRKFFSYLVTAGVLPQDPFVVITKEDAVFEKFFGPAFREYLVQEKASALTIKNYIIDLKQCLQWAGRQDLLPATLEEKSLSSLITTYHIFLKRNEFSEATMNRKLYSLKKYQTFMKEEVLSKTTAHLPVEKHSRFHLLRRLAPVQSLSKPAISAFQKKYPLLSATYQSMQKTYAIHFLIFAIYTTAFGVLLSYSLARNYLSTNHATTYVHDTPFSLTYAVKGQLLRPDHTPITHPTIITFALYTDPVSSDKAQVWEDTVTVTPARDGAFTVVLGSRHPIPVALLTQKHDLYLGARIGKTQVMPGRHNIAAGSPVRIITR